MLVTRVRLPAYLYIVQPNVYIVLLGVATVRAEYREAACKEEMGRINRKTDSVRRPGAADDNARDGRWMTQRRPAEAGGASRQ